MCYNNQYLIQEQGICPEAFFNMYTHSVMKVRWRSETSNSFTLQNGVKQGVFGYVDDLVLVSPTIHGLKEIIKICEDYNCEFDIMFNPNVRIKKLQ